MPAPPGHIPRLSKCRWSADTELAFLLALRLTGQAKAAALEIGRPPGSAYARRRRNAEFARRWDEMVDAQQGDWIAAQQERLAEGRAGAEDPGGQLAPWRTARDGFGPVKRALFLRVLTRTKHVEQACKAAGVASSTVYALRTRSVRFAAAWDKALADPAPPSVREAALARAVDGWEEPIVHAGQVVAYKRRYSDGLLRDLLRAELRGAGEGKAAAVKPWQRPRTLDEVRDSILGKLEAIEQHRAESEEAEAEADWSRWRRSWTARR